MAKLHPDLREFVEKLNSGKVEFLVAGAHALAIHGHPRYTCDIDLFVRISEANTRRILTVLEEFGFGEVAITANDLVRPNFVIQLGLPPNRIDILTGIDGCTFDEAWSDKLESEIDGIPVFTLSREMLIRNKKASGRPKDLSDLDALERG